MSFGNSPPRITESFKRFVTSLPALPAWPFFKFDSPFVAFPFHRHATRNILQVLQHTDFYLVFLPPSLSLLLFFLSLLASRRGDKSFWITMDFHLFFLFFFFFQEMPFKKSHRAYYRTNRACPCLFRFIRPWYEENERAVDLSPTGQLH